MNLLSEYLRAAGSRAKTVLDSTEPKPEQGFPAPRIPIHIAQSDGNYCRQNWSICLFKVDITLDLEIPSFSAQLKESEGVLVLREQLGPTATAIQKKSLRHIHNQKMACRY